jgi:hypothetical protein
MVVGFASATIKMFNSVMTSSPTRFPFRCSSDHAERATKRGKSRFRQEILSRSFTAMGKQGVTQIAVCRSAAAASARRLEPGFWTFGGPRAA